MVTSKKKPTAAKASWSERVVSHPKITLATVATVVGILGIVAPWLMAWEDQYQRKIAAKEAEAMIRSEIKAQAARDERARAWQQYGQIRTEAIVLRNRMNDCAVQASSGIKQSPLEVAVCKQYEDEWRDADERAKAARKTAQDMGRVGP